MIGGTDTVYSDFAIGNGALQYISMQGLGVQTHQVKSLDAGGIFLAQPDHTPDLSMKIPPAYKSLPLTYLPMQN